eukprot:m.236807 g.236807  ORF g.236807 m.236807 type:complete len:586 (-) comp19355_c0_seq2:514-2271(-)
MTSRNSPRQLSKIPRPTAIQKSKTIGQTPCGLADLSLAGTQCSPVSIRKIRPGTEASSVPKVSTEAPSKAPTNSQPSQRAVQSRPRKNKADISSNSTKSLPQKQTTKEQDLRLRSGIVHHDGSRDIYVDTSATMYSVIRRVTVQLGWKEAALEDEKTMLVWRDECLKPKDITLMRSTGLRWNHMPGVESMCTKCGLQQTIGRVAAAYPKSFGFFPKCWSLPVQWIKLDHYMKTKGIKNGTVLILKPNTSSRGRGIELTKEIPKRGSDSVMVQEYIQRPLTIKGLKFDLRMYALITDVRCCDTDGMPRVYLHHEGLTRFCTTAYQTPDDSNMHDNTQHLSNYSVNKWSAAYVKSPKVKEDLAMMMKISEEDRAHGGLLPRGGSYVFGGGADAGLDESVFARQIRQEQSGSKWTLTAFASWARANGIDTDLVWRRCCDLAAKTALAATVATMRQHYYDNFGADAAGQGMRCFELLGLDVLLDEQCKPHLLEVNMSPSIATDTALDLLVKETVHQEALLLASIPPAPSPSLERPGCNIDPGTERAPSPAAVRAWRDAHDATVCRGFQRLLPPPDGSTRYNEIATFTRR